MNINLKKLTTGAIAASFLFCASYEANFLYDDYKKTGGDSLTKGEKSLIQEVFNHDINTTFLKKHHDPNLKNSGFVPSSSRQHLIFKEKTEDYSTTKGSNLHLFMHEITHIWQHQSNYPTYIFNYCPPESDENYGNFNFTSQSKFDDFCNEQQAEIIGYYVSTVLYPEHERAGIYNKTDKTELIRIVEEKFPHAQQARKRQEEIYLKTNRPFDLPESYKKTLSIS